MPLMLWSVSLTVVGKSEIVVEASDHISARAVAEAALVGARPGQLELHSDEIEVNVVFSTAGDQAARCSTYTCAHCGAQRLKADWGPGRITCPACHKIAPSALEAAGKSPEALDDDLREQLGALVLDKTVDGNLILDCNLEALVATARRVLARRSAAGEAK